MRDASKARSHSHCERDGVREHNLSATYLTAAYRKERHLKARNLPRNTRTIPSGWIVLAQDLEFGPALPYRSRPAIERVSGPAGE